jgi:hypothetical protein
MPTFSREQPKPLKFDAGVNARNSRRLDPAIAADQSLMVALAFQFVGQAQGSSLSQGVYNLITV